MVDDDVLARVREFVTKRRERYRMHPSLLNEYQLGAVDVLDELEDVLSEPGDEPYHQTGTPVSSTEPTGEPSPADAPETSTPPSRTPDK